MIIEDPYEAEQERKEYLRKAEYLLGKILQGVFALLKVALKILLTSLWGVLEVIGLKKR